MHPNAPYLSVVVTARNDEHGGNLLQRMQTFVSSLLAQCRRHDLNAELLIVEWNPPGDRPPLAQALRWPNRQTSAAVRIIEVPPQIHRRFVHSQELPLYQMIAKNVGIRRALGEYILATNIDILFSDELMRFIAERKLEPGKMYRIDRHDVMSDVPVDASVESQLGYCRSHLIRVNAREGTCRLTPDGVRSLEPADITTPNSGLTLGPRWFLPESFADGVWRWVDNDAEIFIRPSEKETTLVLDVETGPGLNHQPFRLELHDDAGALVSSAHIDRRAVVTLAVPVSASGNRRFRLHALGGGTKIAWDPRVLNFRVRRCELAVLTDARKVAAKLRAANRASGFATDHQILPPGVSARWMKGWYLPEAFENDTFRWMNPDSSLILFLPGGPSSMLTLEVEGGPALGFKPVEIEVQDQWGATLATARINKRTQVQVPLPSVKGAFVLSLHARGGSKPKKVAGDLRNMALRLYRMLWSGAGNDNGEDRSTVQVGFFGSEVWCSDGWISIPPGSKHGAAAFHDAELILRAPYGDQRTVILDVESTDGKAHELRVQDPGGRVLFRGLISGKQEIRLTESFLSGNYYVLRLLASEMEKDGMGDKQDPKLLLSSLTFRGENTGEELRVAITIPAPGSHQNRTYAPAHLHTNGCGDFTLMARQHWMDVRGYPEFDMFSMNLDSVLCYAAHHGGATEEILTDPMRIYHIEHGIGSGWTPEGQKKLFDRIAAKGLSSLDYQEVLHWARVMNRAGAAMIFNREDWGLQPEELRETFPLAQATTNATA